jgi:hypothetical protein
VGKRRNGSIRRRSFQKAKEEMKYEGRMEESG